MPLSKKKNGMGQCGKCLENNWHFSFADGLVTAICKYCENEVCFQSRKAKKKKCATTRAEKMAAFSLYHRHVPSTLPVDRPAHIMPWD